VGAYSAPPDSLAVFKGPTSKEREAEEGKGKGSGREGEGKGRKGKTRGWEGKGDQAPNISAWNRRVTAPERNPKISSVVCVG